MGQSAVGYLRICAMAGNSSIIQILFAAAFDHTLKFPAWSLLLGLAGHTQLSLLQLPQGLDKLKRIDRGAQLHDILFR